MLMNEILIHRRKNLSLFQQTKELTLYSLVGCASKKMRGITLNYDDANKSIETIIFFDMELSEEEEEKLNNFLDKLEENDDVQNVWHNADI